MKEDKEVLSDVHVNLDILVRIDAKWDTLLHRDSCPYEWVSSCLACPSSSPWNPPLSLSDEQAQGHGHAKDVRSQNDSQYSLRHLRRRSRLVEYLIDQEYWSVHFLFRPRRDIFYPVRERHEEPVFDDEWTPYSIARGLASSSWPGKSTCTQTIRCLLEGKLLSC